MASIDLTSHTVPPSGVAMLLVTHEGLASALAALVGHVFGEAAMSRVGVVELHAGKSPESALAEAIHWSNICGAASILAISDLHGSTPWRVVNDLATRLRPLEVQTISGANAAMVLSVVERWDSLGLNQLAQRARAEGRRGIA